MELSPAIASSRFNKLDAASIASTAHSLFRTQIPMNMTSDRPGSSLSYQDSGRIQGKETSSPRKSDDAGVLASSSVGSSSTPNYRKPRNEPSRPSIPMTMAMAIPSTTYTTQPIAIRAAGIQSTGTTPSRDEEMERLKVEVNTMRVEMMFAQNMSALYLARKFLGRVDCFVGTV